MPANQKQRGQQVIEREKQRIRARQARQARERAAPVEDELLNAITSGGDLEDAGDILAGLAGSIPIIGPLVTGLLGGSGGDKGGSDGSKGATGSMDPATMMQMMMAGGMGQKSTGGDLGPLTSLLAAQAGASKTDPMTSLLAAQALNAKSDNSGGKVTSDPEVRALLEQLVAKVDAQGVASAQAKSFDEARKVAGDTGKTMGDEVKAAVDPYLSQIKGDLDFQQRQTQATYEAGNILRRRAFESAVLAKLNQVIAQNAELAGWPRRY